MASRTLQDLTNLGFDQAKVREALQAIGNPADKEAAINWLLDHGEEDRGGTVELKHCPHVEEFSHPFAPQKLIKRSSMAFHNQCHQGCPGSENWCCLLCGETRCGRYAKKHSLAHWEEKKREQEANLTVADAAARKEAIGHCLVLGLSDLTVWCYECQAYVDHVVAIRYYSSVLFFRSSDAEPCTTVRLFYGKIIGHFSLSDIRKL